MKLYRTNNWTTMRPIEEIELKIEKETDSTMWVNGKRMAKYTELYCYFKTYDEAKNYLILMQNQKIRTIELSLKIAQNQLQRLNEL
jgi:hypothetical protein